MPNRKQFPTGGVSTPTSDSTSTPANHAPTTDRQTDQPNLETQLAEAEALLEACGWERQADGSYTQTPEAHQSEVYSLDLDSYEFRDLVRAEDPVALDRLQEEIEDALSECGNKFGLDGAVFEMEAGEEVRELLIRYIEDEAEHDAQLKKEEEEEAEEETPSALSLVRGTGSVTPAGGGAE